MKRAYNDQPWSVVCQFISMCKDVSKYIEFSNLDTAFDFYLHVKDCTVRRNIYISVCLLFPKILTGFVYLQNVFFFKHQHFPTSTLAIFFLLQWLRTEHELEDSVTLPRALLFLFCIKCVMSVSFCILKPDWSWDVSRGDLKHFSVCRQTGEGIYCIAGRDLDILDEYVLEGKPWLLSPQYRCLVLF